MYSFEFSSLIKNALKNDYMLSIFFDGVLIGSRIVQFSNAVTQEDLDDFANSVIDSLEGNA